MSSENKPIVRNLGETESENYLKKLCDKTFLSLWSYPGIFRDQGNIGKGDGKEICDLLVVFDKHVLIFSDKKCVFPSTNDLKQDWKRWYRRAVEKSVIQLFGAERWINSYPDRIFLDKKCTHPFPLKLSEAKDIKYHRIVVAHDSKDRCQKELGGSGSLMIVPSLDGEHNLNSPFSVGYIKKEKGFVHVLDDTTLDILMNTLDTITDFVAYLEKKENFIESGKLIGAAGDEDLLGYYLKYLNENNEHDFNIPSDHSGNPSAIAIDEGFWEIFNKSTERKSQIKANEMSYSWDLLIETFTKHIVNFTQYHTTDSKISSNELALRFLAKEPRTRRRLLTDAIFGLMNKTPNSVRGTRIVLPSNIGDPFYIFLLLPRLKNMVEKDYRLVRRNLLQNYCFVLKLKFPEAQDIIGIATETINDTGLRSEDLLYFDAREWNIQGHNNAVSVQNELGLLKNTTMFERTYEEYPKVEIGNRKRKKIKPNEPCYCGSGKKFKKCHGKFGGG